MVQLEFVSDLVLVQPNTVIKLSFNKINHYMVIYILVYTQHLKRAGQRHTSHFLFSQSLLNSLQSGFHPLHSTEITLERSEMM